MTCTVCHNFDKPNTATGNSCFRTISYYFQMFCTEISVTTNNFLVWGITFCMVNDLLLVVLLRHYTVVSDQSVSQNSFYGS